MSAAGQFRCVMRAQSFPLPGGPPGQPSAAGRWRVHVKQAAHQSCCFLTSYNHSLRVIYLPEYPNAPVTACMFEAILITISISVNLLETLFRPD
jgi:hypothetical protein